MMMTLLSEVEIKILRALETYRLLTPAQLHRLGITRNIKHLYVSLSKLRDCSRPFVARMHPGSLVGYGRLPQPHYLTEQGARQLCQAYDLTLANIAYPRGKREVVLTQTFFHRMACTDIEISVRTWAKQNYHTVNFFFPDKSPKGKIKYSQGALNPDAVFMLTDSGQASRLFLLEMHRDKFDASPDTKRIGEKLMEYRFPLSKAEGSISRQFNYPHAPRILVVFNSEKSMLLAKKWLNSKKDFDSFQPYFYFNTLPHVQNDFISRWFRLSEGQAAKLF